MALPPVALPAAIPGAWLTPSPYVIWASWLCRVPCAWSVETYSTYLVFVVCLFPRHYHNSLHTSPTPNPMAAVRAMMSVVKEEAAVITTEVAASARVGVAEAVAGPSRAAAEVVNPLAVRQTVEASVKEAAQGE